MADYVPMQGKLPGIQYDPSNGEEAECFLEEWCANCARDRAMREGVDPDDCDENELCGILAASFRGAAVEWRELKNNRTVCLAFVKAEPT